MSVSSAALRRSLSDAEKLPYEHRLLPPRRAPTPSCSYSGPQVRHSIIHIHIIYRRAGLQILPILPLAMSWVSVQRDDQPELLIISTAERSCHEGIVEFASIVVCCCCLINLPVVCCAGAVLG